MYTYIHVYIHTYINTYRKEFNTRRSQSAHQTVDGLLEDTTTTTTTTLPLTSTTTPPTTRHNDGKYNVYVREGERAQEREKDCPSSICLLRFDVFLLSLFSIRHSCIIHTYIRTYIHTYIHTHIDLVVDYEAAYQSPSNEKESSTPGKQPTVCVHTYIHKPRY